MDDQMKLPRSSYDELCKIVKAYARSREAVSLSEISKLTGINKTLISANAGFLVAADIILPGGSKQSTDKGQRLGIALEHDMPIEIASAWREVVVSTDFLHKMVAAVRIRKGMDIEALQGHIAYSAGVAKSAVSLTGARTVANILVVSGLIQERDGKLVAVPENELPPSPTTETTSGLTRYTEGATVPSSQLVGTSGTVPIAYIGHSGSGASVAVKIEINLQVTVADLATLGKSLKNLLEDLGL